MEVIPVDDPAEAGKRLSELVDGRHTAIPPRSGRPLVKLGKVARDYIWGEMVTEEIDPAVKIEDAVRRYDMIRRGRIMLERIVKLSRRPHTQRSSFALTSNEVSLEEMRLVKTDQYHHEQGHIVPEYEIRIVKQPSLLDALDHSPARIRKCEAVRCGRFFWATRDDQRGHDPKCSAAIRQAQKRKRSRGTKE